MSATNVSQFAQPKKHHGQQCVRNNVSSFTRALTSKYFGNGKNACRRAAKRTVIVLFRQDIKVLTAARNAGAAVVCKEMIDI